MASISKKNKRKALVQIIANHEFEKEVARMPISKENLKELFDFLERPNSPACDETLKDTIQFLKGTPNKNSNFSKFYDKQPLNIIF